MEIYFIGSSCKIAGLMTGIFSFYPQKFSFVGKAHYRNDCLTSFTLSARSMMPLNGYHHSHDHQSQYIKYTKLLKVYTRLPLFKSRQ